MKITVTGGASFIGSHLVDALLAEGNEVQIIDDLSSGTLDNLPPDDTWYGRLKVTTIDLREELPRRIATQIRSSDIVYHLAADHGGRGYVETRQVATSNNFAIDNNVFQACILANVPKIIFASSGCVYPICLQGEENLYGTKEPYSLSEDDIKAIGHTGYSWGDDIGGYDPDGLYGLAKLTGELTLQEIYKENGIESVSCRFFTVYGPRAKENHAIISFIARAFIRQDPWQVWGDGTQIRNWTHVRDIIQGLLLARDLPGCQALNIGTEEHITVRQAVFKTIDLANKYHFTRAISIPKNYKPMINWDLTKPTGPMVRVASSQKYKDLGGTFTPFDEGLEETLNWYFSSHDRDQVAADFERLLIERK